MRFMTSLRFIDVVAREGSIRKAADKLAITSTALNRRILQIEEEIGQPLFERLPGGVRLNTAGEIFLQHIRSQFADLARARSANCERICCRKISPAVFSLTPPGNRSNSGWPISSSIWSILRFSAVEVMASLSAALRIEPSRATTSMNLRLVINRMAGSGTKGYPSYISA